jgi:hypothetical protein
MRLTKANGAKQVFRDTNLLLSIAWFDRFDSKGLEGLLPRTLFARLELSLDSQLPASG